MDVFYCKHKMLFEQHVSAQRHSMRPNFLWGNRPAGLGFSGNSYGFFSSFLLASSPLAFIASLKPRIPSPNPLPSSGSFLGPKTRRAMKAIMSRCVRLEQIVKHDDSFYP